MASIPNNTCTSTSLFNKIPYKYIIYFATTSISLKNQLCMGKKYLNDLPMNETCSSKN